MTRVHAQRLSWRMGATYAGQTAASQRMDFAARFEEMEVLFTMLHKLRGMVRRQPAGAAEASPCSAVTAEPALAMPLARLSQLSPGCDPGARSRVMGTPCYALPKHARREKGICRSPLMVGIDKFDYLR